MKMKNRSKTQARVMTKTAVRHSLFTTAFNRLTLNCPGIDGPMKDGLSKTTGQEKRMPRQQAFFDQASLQCSPKFKTKTGHGLVPNKNYPDTNPGEN
jgi:hypothetical protein